MMIVGNELEVKEFEGNVITDKKNDLESINEMAYKVKRAIGVILLFAAMNAMGCSSCNDEKEEAKQSEKTKESANKQQKDAGVILPIIPPSNNVEVEGDDIDINIEDRDTNKGVKREPVLKPASKAKINACRDVIKQTPPSLETKKVSSHIVRPGDSYVRIATLHLDEYPNDAWTSLLATRSRVLPVHFAAIIAYHNENTFNDVLVPGQTLLLPTPKQLVAYTWDFSRIWNVVTTGYKYDDENVDVEINNVERLEIEDGDVEVRVDDDLTGYPPKIPLVYEPTHRLFLEREEYRRQIIRLKSELNDRNVRLERLKREIKGVEMRLDDLQEKCRECTYIYENDVSPNIVNAFNGKLEVWGVSSDTANVSIAGNLEML